MTHPVTSVAISLGNNTDLIIGKDDHLYVVHDPDSSDPTLISLGLATAHGINNVIACLNRLMTHAVDL